MLDHEKWPTLRCSAGDAIEALEARLSKGRLLVSERIITSKQLQNLLDRAVQWRAENKDVLDVLFDASARNTYQERDWEDFVGSAYSDAHMLRRIRELISRDDLYLTVLLAYVKTTGGHTPAKADASKAYSDTETSVDVFISHSSADADIADALVALLRAGLNLHSEQIRCTSVRGYKLAAGAVTDDQLRAEIYQATAFIGLITGASMESAYVLFELGGRWLADKHLVPLLAAGADANALQGPLKKYNALSADSVEDMHQFLADLASHLRVKVERAAAYQKQLDALLQVSQSHRDRPTAAMSLPVSVNTHRNRALTRDEILGILQAWLGNRPATENRKPIYFDAVDAELGLPGGSARELLEIAATRYRYVVERKGPNLILFRQQPLTTKIAGGF